MKKFGFIIFESERKDEKQGFIKKYCSLLNVNLNLLHVR
jgi:hypothetical protein